MQSRSAVPPDTGELVREEVKSKIMQTSVLNVGLHCKSKIKQCTRCRCCCCCSSAICRSSSSFLIADSSRRRTSFKTWNFNIAMQYDWSKLAVWPERNCQMSLKSGPKLISLEIWNILTHLTNCLKCGNLLKIIVATCLEKLPKVQKIAQSCHTGSNLSPDMQQPIRMLYFRVE